MDITKKVLKIGTSHGIHFSKDEMSDLDLKAGTYVRMSVRKIQPSLLITTKTGNVYKSYGVKFKMINGRSFLMLDCPETDSSGAIEFQVIKSIEELQS